MGCKNRGSVGCIIGLFCNEGVSYGVNDLTFSASFTIDQVGSVIDSALATVDYVLLDLNQTVDSIAAQILAVPSSVIQPTLLRSVNNLVTPLNLAQPSIDGVSTQLNTIVRTMPPRPGTGRADGCMDSSRLFHLNSHPRTQPAPNPTNPTQPPDPGDDGDNGDPVQPRRSHHDRQQFADESDHSTHLRSGQFVSYVPRKRPREGRSAVVPRLMGLQ